MSVIETILLFDVLVWINSCFDIGINLQLMILIKCNFAMFAMFEGLCGWLCLACLFYYGFVCWLLCSFSINVWMNRCPGGICMNKELKHITAWWSLLWRMQVCILLQSRRQLCASRIWWKPGRSWKRPFSELKCWRQQCSPEFCMCLFIFLFQFNLI